MQHCYHSKGLEPAYPCCIRPHQLSSGVPANYQHIWPTFSACSQPGPAHLLWQPSHAICTGRVAHCMQWSFHACMFLLVMVCAVLHDDPSKLLGPAHSFLHLGGCIVCAACCTTAHSMQQRQLRRCVQVCSFWPSRGTVPKAAPAPQSAPAHMLQACT